MIARRNSGVSFVSLWLLLAWVVFWFGLHLVIGVEVFGTITYAQTNYGVYFLGVFLAQLLRIGAQKEESMGQAPSSRWLNAITDSNKDILFLLTILFAIVFVTKDKGISRVFLSTFLVSLWPTLLLLRRYLPFFLSGLFFGKTQQFTTVLVGSAEKFKSLESFVRDLPKSGMKVAGLVSVDGAVAGRVSDSVDIIGQLNELESILDKYAVDQVIVLDGGKSKEWFTDVFHVCDQFGCHVMVYNFWQDYFDQPVHFARHGVHTFFTLQDEPLQNPINRMLKRLLDIAISLPIVFGVLPFLCLWVMIRQAKEAPGPLFFIQYRSGFQKKRFKIFKFRSMYSDDERVSEATQASRGDCRIYPFGAFIRRRSIDEFPQFINVLKGDMSVVGPRPHLIQHDAAFAETIGTYRVRHYVKPGLTGLAQVNGFRGEVTEERLIRERVRLDIAYINSWSLGLDFDLIFKTISELFHPSDQAY